MVVRRRGCPVIVSRVTEPRQDIVHELRDRLIPHVSQNIDPRCVGLKEVFRQYVAGSLRAGVCADERDTALHVLDEEVLGESVLVVRLR